MSFFFVPVVIRTSHVLISQNPIHVFDLLLFSLFFSFQCRPGDGMKGFFELLYEEPTKMMILGASCSVVSQPVAETSQHWNMVQVSLISLDDTRRIDPAPLNLMTSRYHRPQQHTLCRSQSDFRSCNGRR